MIYTSINKFDVAEFHDFVDTNNWISQILIAHFLAIQMILVPILDREWAGRIKTTPARMNIVWITSILEGTPYNLRHFLNWPTAIMEAVGDELAGKQNIIPRISILRKNEGFSKDLV
jgi:hypothetical protein